MKLTKEQYDALPDHMKALFKADGEGYVSTFATAEEVQGLKDNNAALVAEKAAMKDKETAAQKAAREAQEKADREAGNIAALDKSWGEKLTATETASKAQIDKLTAALNKATVGAAATQLGTKLFGERSGVLQSHVTNRLTMEEADGEFKIRVLGADGKPSAHSLEDLEKEFRANKEFAPFLTGTAGGGGPKIPVTTVESGGLKLGGAAQAQQDLVAQAQALMGDD